jgi:glycosyltransferase involved in cell wall biosynthesis
MRILQLHNRYREAGGEDSVVRDETRLLRAAGHEVIEHHVSNPTGRLATAGALTLSPSNPMSARAVKRVVASQRPDVAHIHNTWYSLSPSVVPALKHSGVPVVVTLHNYRLFCVNALLFRDGRPCEECVGTHPWRGVQHRCYRDSAVASVFAASTIAIGRARRTWSTGVDRFVAPSWFLRDKLVAGGIPAETITVKPHGVDDPGPRSTPPSSSRSVLFLGRLSHEKGADTLLDAWAARGASRLELVLVGDGPLRERLEARGVGGVRFAGWQSPADVARLLLGARALVFPSVCYENLPRAVIEAMAAGLPVLASDHGGPAELVRDLGPEWTAAAGSEQAWAGALAVLDDDTVVDIAGARARATFERQYTEAASLTGLLEVYGSVLRGAAGGAAGATGPAGAADELLEHTVGHRG